ncbi:MAG: class I SAM-dependent methyltransferase [Bacteroidales bacterium]|nr:class I SAM-dependent methyltransferase [Bacteroidales bacterium]
MPVKDNYQHNIEIGENLEYWKNKPVLQKIYTRFYQQINNYIDRNIPGEIVELGSGIGNIKLVIPDAITTDVFPNPWIDRIENVYNLSFKDHSVSHVLLFDVFHHIQFPGNALDEIYRVLVPGGRVILFEPAISLFGSIVYGLLHHEPVNYFKKIHWFAENNNSLEHQKYYAAQGNAQRIFFHSRYKKLLQNWIILEKKKITSLAYVASGGYSKPQLYPDKWLTGFQKLDKILGNMPCVFSTRLLLVIEKP